MGDNNKSSVQSVQEIVDGATNESVKAKAVEAMPAAEKIKTVTKIGHLITDAPAEKDLEVEVIEQPLQEEYVQKFYVGQKLQKSSKSDAPIMQDYIQSKIESIANCYEGAANAGIKDRLKELSSEIVNITKTLPASKQKAKPAILLGSSEKFIEVSKNIAKVLQAAAENLDFNNKEDIDTFNGIASLSILVEQQDINAEEMKKAESDLEKIVQETAFKKLNIPATTVLLKVIDHITERIKQNPKEYLKEDLCFTNGNAYDEAIDHDKKIIENAKADLYAVFLAMYDQQDDASEIKRKEAPYRVDTAVLEKLEKESLELLEELAYTTRHKLVHPLLESQDALTALTYFESLLMPNPQNKEQSRKFPLDPENLSWLGGGASYLQKFNKLPICFSAKEAYLNSGIKIQDLQDIAWDVVEELQKEVRENSPAELSTPAIGVIQDKVAMAMLNKTETLMEEDEQQTKQIEILKKHPLVTSIAEFIEAKYSNREARDPDQNKKWLLEREYAVREIDRIPNPDHALLNLTENPLPIFVKTNSFSENMKNLLSKDFINQPNETLRFTIPYTNATRTAGNIKQNVDKLDKALKEVTQHNNSELEKASSMLQAYDNITGKPHKIGCELLCKQQKLKSTVVRDHNTLRCELDSKEKNTSLNLESNLKQPKKDEQISYVAATSSVAIDKIFTNNQADHHLMHNILSCKNLLESGMYVMVEKQDAKEENAKETIVNASELITDPSEMIKMTHNSCKLSDKPELFGSFEITQRKDQSSDAKHFIIKPAHGFSAKMKEFFDQKLTLKQEKNDKLLIISKQTRKDAQEKKAYAVMNLSQSKILEMFTKQTGDQQVDAFAAIKLISEDIYYQEAAGKVLTLAITPIIEKIKSCQPDEENKEPGAIVAIQSLNKALQENVQIKLDPSTKTLTCEVDLTNLTNDPNIKIMEDKNIEQYSKDLAKIARHNKVNKGLEVKVDAKKLIVTQTKPQELKDFTINAENLVDAENVNKDLQSAYKAALQFLKTSGREEGGDNRENLKGIRKDTISKLHSIVTTPITNYVNEECKRIMDEAAKNATHPASPAETEKEKAPVVEDKKQASETVNIAEPNAIKEAASHVQIDESKKEEVQSMLRNASQAVDKLPAKCAIKLKKQSQDEEDTKDKEQEKDQRAVLKAVFAAIADAASQKMNEKSATETTGFFDKAKKVMQKSLNTAWSKVIAPISYSPALKIKDMVFGAPDKATELKRALNRSCLLRNVDNVQFAITGFATLLSETQQADKSNVEINQKTELLLKKFENIEIEDKDVNAVLAAILSGDTSSIEITAQADKKEETPAKAPAIAQTQATPSTVSSNANATPANSAKQETMSMSA